MSSRETLFKKEIEYIESKDLKEALIKLLDLLPDYWLTEAASSTGKYHPEYALGKGGLLRHSKAAMRIGYELLENPCIGEKYTKRQKDLLLMSLLVHDGLKLGLPQEKYTRFDHPILMADFILKNKEEIGLSQEETEFMASVIQTHMGPWTTDYNGNEVLEKPKTKYQTFVHMCDYLASRKCLLLPFDKENNIIDN
ncbi:MAG: HD domain-containing protein [Bacilli bacterium]|nr:HD domain-containing protein [Bacilli bacterium]